MRPLILPSHSEFAVRFAVVSALLLLLAIAIGTALLKLLPIAPSLPPNHFPRAFIISTILLLIGSWSLSRACAFVRRERQVPFRRHLLISLAAGTLFVAMQTYALTSLIRQQRPEDISTAAAPYVAVMVALHAMHFVVALMFLVFVTVQAFADRYDHEYYFGVTICTWFWHALGIVWLVVMAVIGIVSLPLGG
ncbi:MAG: cytochrome o ubiquinol oxidase subunit [Schlesneria sp.]|nr:cytochrome o ubiquinol oxidase subunit [Schlesneria sp.]